MGRPQRGATGGASGDAVAPRRPSREDGSTRGLRRSPAVAASGAASSRDLTLPAVPFSAEMDAPSSLLRGLEGPHTGLWLGSGARSEPGLRREPDEFTAAAAVSPRYERSEAPVRDPAHFVLAAFSEAGGGGGAHTPRGAVEYLARPIRNDAAPPRSPQQAAPVPLQRISEEMYDYLLAEDIPDEEDPVEAEERINDMMVDLEEQGAYRTEAIIAAGRCESAVLDLRARWQAESERLGSRIPIQEWALRQFALEEFEGGRDELDLEVQIRSLGRLAGLSYEEQRRKLVDAWRRTPVTSASRSAASARLRAAGKQMASAGPPPRALSERLEPAACEERARPPQGPPPDSSPRRQTSASSPQQPGKDSTKPRPKDGGSKSSGSGSELSDRGNNSPSQGEVNMEVLKLLKKVQDQVDKKDQPPAETAAGSSVLPPPVSASYPMEAVAAMYTGGCSIAGLEFKQQLPVISDSDLDFERHLRDFRSIVDCYALTKRAGVRPYDLLVVFKRTLAAGSTRLKVYETAMAIATRANRLPFQAQAVYDEIIDKLRKSLRESKLQRQTRV